MLPSVWSPLVCVCVCVCVCVGELGLHFVVVVVVVVVAWCSRDSLGSYPEQQGST